MEQTLYPELATELTTDDPVEIKKLIDQYLEAMREKNKHAEKDWEEIYRLRQVRTLTENQLRLEFELRLMKEREAWQQRAQALEEENQQLQKPLKLLPPPSESPDK